MRTNTHDEFVVDENGMTADGYRCLVPVSKKSMYLGKLITIVVSAVILMAFMLIFSSHFHNYEQYVELTVVTILAIIVLYSLISPIIFYKRYRYRIDDDKLEVRRGIVYVRHYMVPVERIHQVEVVRGPINRMFGLADVSVTTAGGSVTLQYLELDVAEDIASSLNDMIVDMLRKRD